MKRIFDITVSLIGLVLLFPLFLIIGVTIKLSGRGTVFFKHERIGKHGKAFILYKFRSMRRDTVNNQNTFEPGDHSRITRIGHFLRDAKLDELPQLINVLKGDMSIVGPRPEVKTWMQIYPERWKKILTIRPGITDNASIKFRYEEKILKESLDPKKTYRDIILPQKLDYYEDYVTNHSLLGDIKLIYQTIIKIFRK